MWMSGVVALALQVLETTRTDSRLLMDPPLGCSLFIGPCITGTGYGGRPSRSRGCGWLVDTEWGRKVGIQFNTASTHSDTRYKVLWIGEIAKHKSIGETKVLRGKEKAKVMRIYWLP